MPKSFEELFRNIWSWIIRWIEQDSKKLNSKFFWIVLGITATIISGIIALYCIIGDAYGGREKMFLDWLFGVGRRL